MAHERARRHRTFFHEFAAGQLPRLQNGVDVLIEGKAAVLDCLHRRHRRNRLAGRCRLKHRLRRDRRAALDVRNAVAFRPCNFEIFDDGDAYARDMELVEQSLDDCGVKRPAGRLRANERKNEDLKENGGPRLCAWRLRGRTIRAARQKRNRRDRRDRRALCTKKTLRSDDRNYSRSRIQPLPPSTAARRP